MPGRATPARDAASTRTNPQQHYSTSRGRLHHHHAQRLHEPEQHHDAASAPSTTPKLSITVSSHTSPRRAPIPISTNHTTTPAGTHTPCPGRARRIQQPACPLTRRRSRSSPHHQLAEDAEPDMLHQPAASAHHHEPHHCSGNQPLTKMHGYTLQLTTQPMPEKSARTMPAHPPRYTMQPTRAMTRR